MQSTVKNIDAEMDDSVNKTSSQMRKGILEFCVLLIIVHDKVYASDILNKLKDVQMIVVEGTLYPLLNRLKREGLLDYSWLESQNGPPRKYYQLTEKGHQSLKLLQKSWDELSESIQNLKTNHETNNIN